MNFQRGRAYSWLCVGLVVVSLATLLANLPAADSISSRWAEQIAVATAVIHQFPWLGYLQRARAEEQSKERKTLDHAPARLGLLVPSYRQEQGL